MAMACVWGSRECNGCGECFESAECELCGKAVTNDYFETRFGVFCVSCAEYRTGCGGEVCALCGDALSGEAVCGFGEICLCTYCAERYRS